MNNIKSLFLKNKILSYFIVFFIIVLLLYFLFSLYISFSLNGIIKNAINDRPYNNNISHIINAENYSYLNPRQPELEENKEVTNKGNNTFPFILPLITDAYYTYSYTSTDMNTNEVIYGADKCHVTIKLEYRFPSIYVLDVEEAS